MWPRRLPTRHREMVYGRRKPAPLLRRVFAHATVGGLLSRRTRHLRIRMAGLCYDTSHVEAVTFPVAVPDKPPRALSSDFIRKHFRIHHFSGGVCGTFSLYRHVSRKKVRCNRCEAADTERPARHPPRGRPRSRGGVGEPREKVATMPERHAWGRDRLLRRERGATRWGLVMGGTLAAPLDTTRGM